jgi:hypothetical protein
LLDRAGRCAAPEHLLIGSTLQFIRIKGGSRMPNSIDRAIIALGDLGKAVAIVLLALAALIATPPTAMAQDNSDGGIRLVTQNMYVGSSFEPLATQPQQLALAVTTIYNNIVATKPAERAAAMAREIARHPPDLIALQEAAWLANRPLGCAGYDDANRFRAIAAR